MNVWAARGALMVVALGVFAAVSVGGEAGATCPGTGERTRTCSTTTTGQETTTAPTTVPETTVATTTTVPVVESTTTSVPVESTTTSSTSVPETSTSGPQPRTPETLPPTGLSTGQENLAWFGAFLLALGALGVGARQLAARKSHP